MDDNAMTDLKQFIVGVIARQTAGIRQDLHAGLADVRADLLRLEAKVDDGFAAIAGILEDMHARSDSQEYQLKDHANRLIQLERKVI